MGGREGKGGMDGLSPTQVETAISSYHSVLCPVLTKEGEDLPSDVRPGGGRKQPSEVHRPAVATTSQDKGRSLH